MPNSSLLPFLLYLPVWLFFILLNWAGYKLMDIVAGIFRKKILIEDSFIKELYFWSLLSIVSALFFCFVFTNYGAQLKRYDFIRLIYLIINNMILYLTFWIYSFIRPLKIRNIVKYSSRVRKRNILLFVLFNLLGNIIGFISPVSYHGTYYTDYVTLTERHSSLVNLIVTLILTAILIFYRQQKNRNQFAQHSS
jgi:hypothetical protein